MERTATTESQQPETIAKVHKRTAPSLVLRAVVDDRSGLMFLTLTIPFRRWETALLPFRRWDKPLEDTLPSKCRRSLVLPNHLQTPR